jgi:hypothetical protein
MDRKIPYIVSIVLFWIVFFITKGPFFLLTKKNWTNNIHPTNAKEEKDAALDPNIDRPVMQ